MALWLAFHLLVGAGGAWLARSYALRRGLLDQPGERRSHKIPTPRSGGIGIVVALLVGGLWLLRDAFGAGAMLGTGLAGFAVIAAVGLVDDHRPLSPWFRLTVHAGAALLLAAGAWWSWHEPILVVVAFGLSMVLTNVWNFMDGIDGIATSQAMLVSAAIAHAVPTGWVFWLACAMVAACAGFLPFNFPRARLFLGDVGSGALGFMLAVLLVSALAATAPASRAGWTLLPSAFLLDATLTLAGRVRRGEAWWRPHDLHAYQRWARRLGSHVAVTLAYATWTAASWALAAGLWMAGTGPVVMLSVSVAWYIAGAAIWWMLQGKGMRALMEDRE